MSVMPLVKSLVLRGLMKVRDHCHYTGKYRGALHSKCNLRLRHSKTIPVFAHNLTGCHLFITRLSDTLGKVNCIPNNEEKYKSISKSVLVDIIVKNEREVEIFYKVEFKDTLSFIKNSLKGLVKNLDKSQFKHLSKYFK